MRCLALASFLWCALASAGTADISWTYPTHNVPGPTAGGTPLTDLADFLLYRRCDAGVLELVETVPASTAAPVGGETGAYIDVQPDDGRTCWYSIIARNALGELSARTNEVSKTFLADAPPAVPGSVASTFTWTATPIGGSGSNVSNYRYLKWTITGRRGAIVEIDNTVAIAFDSYRYYTANDSSDRDPISWWLQGSDDGATWELIDSVTSASITTTRQAVTDTFSNDAGSVSYRYLRWVIWQKRGTTDQNVQVSNFEVLSGGSPVAWNGSATATNPGGTNGNGGAVALLDGDTATKWLDANFAPSDSDMQFSELQLMLGGSAVAWNGSATATNPGGTNPGGEGPDKGIDGSTISTNKFVDQAFPDTADLATGSTVFKVDNTTGISFDGFRFYTANDRIYRDPATWTLEGSNDDTNWTTLHTQSIPPSITVSRNTATQTFYVDDLRVVQVAHANIDASSGSVTATFPAPTTAGNSIAGIVAYSASGGEEIASMTESFVLDGGFTEHSYRVDSFYCDDIAGGATDFTVTLDTSKSYRVLMLVEVAGGTFDDGAFAHDDTASGTDDASSGNVTTTVDGALLLGFYIQITNQNLPTAGTNFARIDTQQNAGGNAQATEARYVDTAGAAAATWTPAGAGYTTWLAGLAFKPAAAPAAASAPPLLNAARMAAMIVH